MCSKEYPLIRSIRSKIFFLRTGATDTRNVYTDMSHLYLAGGLRRIQGITIAKLKGVYKGRATGSTETVLQFLQKPKNQKALEMLRKGYKGREVATLLQLNVNTVSKIKRLGLSASN